MKQKLDIVIVFCGFALSVTALFLESGFQKWLLFFVGIALGIIALYDILVMKEIVRDFRKKKRPSSHITGVSLLNDENQIIGTWDLYEKTSAIIGIDTGENQVDINLAESVYASTLEVEHAVLNYAGGQWYAEDLDSENGVFVMKSDGHKYRLISMRPCLLEKGDILFVSLVRLVLT